MPHVVVDYSENLTGLNAKQLLEEINTTLIETELFSPEDIKSRARKHAKVYILSGRTAEQKQLMGEQLLAALSNKKYLHPEFNKEIQLCVELVDMPREDYFKQVV